MYETESILLLLFLEPPQDGSPVERHDHESV